MDIVCVLLVLGFSCCCLNSAKAVPARQWLTKEDLNKLHISIRSEYLQELEEIKESLTKAFNKELDDVRHKLMKQQDDNKALQEEIAKLKKSEVNEHANDDDGKTMQEATTRDNGIKDVRRNNQNRRLILDGVGESRGVAFTAFLSDFSTGENLGLHQSILFDNVTSNLGNAYDKRQGMFTAPMEGWYVFSLTMMSRPNETQELEVVVDSAQLFKCYSTGPGHTSTSRTVVVHLSQGNEIWVRTFNPSYSPNVHAGGHSSFAGWLLYAD